MLDLLSTEISSALKVLMFTKVLMFMNLLSVNLFSVPQGMESNMFHNAFTRCIIADEKDYYRI